MIVHYDRLLASNARYMFSALTYPVVYGFFYLKFVNKLYSSSLAFSGIRFSNNRMCLSQIRTV